MASRNNPEHTQVGGVGEDLAKALGLYTVGRWINRAIQRIPEVQLPSEPKNPFQRRTPPAPSLHE